MAQHGWGSSDRGDRLPKDWKRLRLRVLARDGHRCRSCGSPANQCDHIIANDDHDMANLQSLCEPCHKAKTIAERPPSLPPRRRPSERHPGSI
jgi:5-methylcytosine-specific restriction protein A